MRPSRFMILAAIAAGITSLAATSVLAQSPLDVVLNGRAAADDTNMTEAGITALLTSGGNLLLLGAGLLGIVLAIGGLMTIFRGHADDDDSRVRAGWIMTAIGGCVTVPAIMAAIVPYMMGV